MASPEQPQDLRDLLRVLTRRWWLVLLVIVGLPAIIYLVSASQRSSYEATAILQVQGAAVDTTLFDAGPSPLQTGSIAATAKLAKSGKVAAAAAARLDPPPPSLKDLTSSVAVTTAQDTGFVTIAARSLRRLRAAAIANAFAEAVIAARSEQARRQVTTTIETVEEQLGRLPDDDRTGRLQLSDQLQRLRALAAAQGSNATLIQTATPPSSPVSPKPVRNALLALVLAILLGVGLAFLLDRLDRRIRNPEELAERTGLPLLSVVPSTALKASQPALYEAESIQALRTNLMYFNVDSPIHSIIVTSPGQGEGKTTVAINLAISMAHSGKDVILIDADLRRSEMAERMGFERTDDNLGAVLARGVPPHRALRDVPTERGRLRVLPAGPTPPNPSELMSSERMRSVLRAARTFADVVIIDATPVLPVSDIVPLLHEVSGIVLLARMKRTTRDALERVQDIIRLADGTVLGVVATAASETEGGYGYGYGRKRRRWLPDPKPRLVTLPEARRAPAPTGRLNRDLDEPSAVDDDDLSAANDRDGAGDEVKPRASRSGSGSQRPRYDRD